MDRVGALPPDQVRALATLSRRLAGTRHPGLGVTVDLVWVDGLPALVSARQPGAWLTSALGGRVLDPLELRGLGAQLAGALHAAHSLDPSVVHGAVRAEVVWACPDGRVLLYGFGQAPSWARPTEEDDVYALGAVLYGLAVGQRLPPRRDLSTVLAHLPDDLARLLAACLDPVPPLRPSARELAARLISDQATAAWQARAASLFTEELQSDVVQEEPTAAMIPVSSGVPLQPLQETAPLPVVPEPPHRLDPPPLEQPVAEAGAAVADHDEVSGPTSAVVTHPEEHSSPVLADPAVAPEPILAVAGPPERFAVPDPSQRAEADEAHPTLRAVTAVQAVRLGGSTSLSVKGRNTAEPASTGRRPLAVAAALILGVVGGGGLSWALLGPSSEPPPDPPVVTVAAPTPAPAAAPPEPAAPDWARLVEVLPPADERHQPTAAAAPDGPPARVTVRVPGASGVHLVCGGGSSDGGTAASLLDPSTARCSVQADFPDGRATGELEATTSAPLTCQRQGDALACS